MVMAAMKTKLLQSGFQWITDGQEFPAQLKKSVVAIGNFDGVHLGHRGVLDAALAKAQELSAPALVLTFEPHPRTFFRPNEPVFRLTPPDEKARLFASLGFAGMVERRFDQAFSQMPASSFVYRLLGQELRTIHAVAGMDFHFGKARFGTPQFLRERAAEMKIGVTLIEPVVDTAGAVISSTRIRKALEQGDIATANALLGRPWRVNGKIIPGKQLGRTLGYPTANMALPAETRLCHGIYAVRIHRADGSMHDAVASFGRRPTFDNGEALLETFVFDFSGDLYGETLGIELIGYLRGEEKFETVDQLIAQMDRDSQAARELLAIGKA